MSGVRGLGKCISASDLLFCRYIAVNAIVMLFLALILSFSGCIESDNNSEDSAEINISSPDFDNEANIPERYSCDGENINPTIVINNIPEDTVSLLLIMDDPDAPSGTFTHWVVWNIDPAVSSINEDSVPGVEGMNSAGITSYVGPCPPSGTHRYFFKLYALDSELAIPPGSERDIVVEAMEGHIIASGELMGRYAR